MPSEIAVGPATESDLPVISQDGCLLAPVLQPKVSDGDVIIAFRIDEPVGDLRLEWLSPKLPYIELVRVLEPHRRVGAKTVVAPWRPRRRSAPAARSYSTRLFSMA